MSLLATRFLASFAILTVLAQISSAQGCCQICPLEFYRDLELLELGPEKETAAVRRFHKWHRAELARRYPLAGLFLEVENRALGDYSQLLRRPGHGTVFGYQAIKVTPVKSALWDDLTREEASIPVKRIEPGPADWRQGHIWTEPGRDKDCCTLCTNRFTFETPSTPLGQVGKSQTEQEIGGQTYTDFLEEVATEFRADVDRHRRQGAAGSLTRKQHGMLSPIGQRQRGRDQQPRFRSSLSKLSRAAVQAAEAVAGGAQSRNPAVTKKFPSWNQNEYPYTSRQLTPGLNDAQLDATAVPQHNPGQQTGSIFNPQRIYNPPAKKKPAPKVAMAGDQAGGWGWTTSGKGTWRKADFGEDVIKPPAPAETDPTQAKPNDKGYPNCCQICSAKVHPQKDYVDQVTTLLQLAQDHHTAALAAIARRRPGYAENFRRTATRRQAHRRRLLQDNTNGGNKGKTLPDRPVEKKNKFTGASLPAGCCDVCPMAHYRPPFAEPHTMEDDLYMAPTGGRNFQKNLWNKRTDYAQEEDGKGKSDPTIPGKDDKGNIVN